MKRTFFLILFSAGVLSISAQQYRRPPDAVVRSYQKEYRYYDNPTWDMQNNQLHTRFRDRDHDNRYADVYYDRYGRRVQTVTIWDRNELSPRIMARIRNRYRDDNYSVYRIERPGRGIFFQITLGDNRRVYLDQRGREVRYY